MWDTDRKASRQKDRERQTGWQTWRQTERWTDRRLEWQTDSQSASQADTLTDRQVDRQTKRKAGRKTDRQTGGLTMEAADCHCASHPFIFLLPPPPTSIHPSFSLFPSTLFAPSPALPATAPLTRDRLGSRGGSGGTEVEGEAIYPRRIRRCVTEVWTVAAGQ